MIYFFGLAGTGAVTANNYGMRIGLLAVSLITQPLAQLAQSRFCSAPAHQLQRTLSSYLCWTVAASVVSAWAIYAFRQQIVTLLYEHGRFTSSDAALVVGLIPAWVVYFVVLSVNSVTARYLFVIGKGRRYALFMLGAYVVANAGRAFWCMMHRSAPGIIWCAVIAEGAAMAFILKLCYGPATVRERAAAGQRAYDEAVEA
jgi:peptidoglycan biosynthesis protein MviN/MurJ (putative lipid II flippase)